MRRLAVAWLVAGLAALVFGAPGAAAAGVSVRVGHVDQDGRVLRVLLSTSSAGLVDEVAVLSRPPARRCPRRLPGWVRVMPLRRASAVRVGLFGLDEATLAVTPRRGHVEAGRTRLCGYALRSGRTVAHATRLVSFDPRVADAPVPPVFPWAHDVIVFGWSVFAVIGLAFGVVWARRWRGLRGGSRRLRPRRRPRRVRRRHRRPPATRVPAYGEAPEGYVLGLAQDGADGGLVVVPEVELVRHTLVLGATGAGKTVTLGVMVGEALHRGHGVVLIDLKGDTQLAARLADEAQAAGRAFSFWGIEGGIAWNPLASGGPSELKDKLIGLEQWSEPHYKRAAERYLQAVFRVLEVNGTSVTLAQVVGLMRPEALRAQTRQAPQEFADEIDAYLDSLDGSSRSAISGLANRLAVITESTAGARFEPAAGAGLDLAGALEQGGLVVFSLNSLRYGELAAQIGGLIIQDLKTIAGDRIERHTPSSRELGALVVIDEFSALEGEHVLALLARARSARLGVVLSTQELSDLERVALGFSDQVLGNTAVKVIHRQDVPESAERLASLAGTTKTWQETFQTDYQLQNALNLLLHDGLSGRGTRKLVDEFRVHPNQFKNLPTGHAIVIRKTTACTPPRP